MKIIYVYLLFGYFDLALGGCCNDNFWCDGDPSFRESPDVIQDQYSKVATVSWNEAYMQLAKCVDYYFVEYAELPNDTAVISRGKGGRGPPPSTRHPPGGRTDAMPTFKKVAVKLERRTSVETWEESIQPIVTKFSAQIKVKYDTVYIIRVVAIDKGAGWGEFEGRAIVKSKNIVFRSRAYQPPPDPVAIARQKIYRRYPPQLCREHQLCVAFAEEWANDVVEHALKHSLRYSDPEPLPSIAVREDQDDEKVEYYEDGRLNNLKHAKGHVSGVEIKDDHTIVNITLQFRLLRTSYLWHAYFTHGILSMYYTCGQPLPIAIFQDVDEDEVEEAISDDCHMEAIVQLKVPIYTKREPADNHHAIRSPSGRIRPKSHPTITYIHFVDLRRQNFAFDVTWFTESFHLLDQIFDKELELIRIVLPKLIRRSFRHAIHNVNTDEWIKNKFISLKEEIRSAAAVANPHLLTTLTPPTSPFTISATTDG